MLVNNFTVSQIAVNNLFVLDLELLRDMPGMVE
jgi:hypothetical protein